MTAGRGVLHSEMPHGSETAHTLQLWLNLPRKMKMIPARYQDQRFADVPVRKLEGGEVRVYAGRSGDVSIGHGSDYPMSLLDIRLEAGAKLGQEVSTRIAVSFTCSRAGRRSAERSRARAMSPGSSRAREMNCQSRRWKPSVACCSPASRSTSRRRLRAVRDEHEAGDPAGFPRLPGGEAGGAAVKFAHGYQTRDHERHQGRSEGSSTSKRSSPTGASAPSAA